MRFSFYSTLAISALLASTMVSAFEQQDDEFAQLAPSAPRYGRLGQAQARAPVRRNMQAAQSRIPGKPLNRRPALGQQSRLASAAQNRSTNKPGMHSQNKTNAESHRLDRLSENRSHTAAATKSAIRAPM